MINEVRKDLPSSPLTVVHSLFLLFVSFLFIFPATDFSLYLPQAVFKMMPIKILSGGWVPRDDRLMLIRLSQSHPDS